MWFHYILFLIAAFLSPAVLPAQTPAPTVADLAYGPHERQVLDFWRAESGSPAPLVIFIHGGGFQALDKSRITPRFVQELLDAGISVAAFNYRFVQTHPFPACFEDVRYALQFLRSKAGEWNINIHKIWWIVFRSTQNTFWLDIIENANPFDWEIL